MKPSGGLTYGHGLCIARRPSGGTPEWCAACANNLDPEGGCQKPSGGSVERYDPLSWKTTPRWAPRMACSRVSFFENENYTAPKRGLRNQPCSWRPTFRTLCSVVVPMGNEKQQVPNGSARKYDLYLGRNKMRNDTLLLEKLIDSNGLLPEKDPRRQAGEKIGQTRTRGQHCSRRLQGKRDGLAGAQQ